MKIRSSILVISLLSLGPLIAPGELQAQAPNGSALEATEINVSAAQAASTIKRIEQMVNHFGGRILSSSAVGGKTDIVVSIPTENAQFFHDNLGGSWTETNSAPSSKDRVFQVTVLFK